MSRPRSALKYLSIFLAQFHFCKMSMIPSHGQGSHFQQAQCIIITVGTSVVNYAGLREEICQCGKRLLMPIWKALGLRAYEGSKNPTMFDGS